MEVAMEEVVKAVETAEAAMAEGKVVVATAEEKVVAAMEVATAAVVFSDQLVELPASAPPARL